MTLKSNIILGSGGHSRVILENLYILKKEYKIYDFNFSSKKIIQSKNIVMILKNIKKRNFKK